MSKDKEPKHSSGETSNPKGYVGKHRDTVIEGYRPGDSKRWDRLNESGGDWATTRE